MLKKIVTLLLLFSAQYAFSQSLFFEPVISKKRDRSVLGLYNKDIQTYYYSINNINYAINRSFYIGLFFH